jgi:ATP-dependent exoDNAse (exonuclease V) alpha subunit
MPSIPLRAGGRAACPRDDLRAAGGAVEAENIALVREFVRDHLTSKGMVADWVYHDKDGNPHIHLMTTLRPLTDDGLATRRSRFSAMTASHCVSSPRIGRRARSSIGCGLVTRTR